MDNLSPRSALDDSATIFSACHDASLLNIYKGCEYKACRIPVNSFAFEVEKSPNKDERGNNVTTVKCHGKLVAETAGEIKSVVHPRNAFVDAGSMRSFATRDPDGLI